MVRTTFGPDGKRIQVINGKIDNIVDAVDGSAEQSTVITNNHAGTDGAVAADGGSATTEDHRDAATDFEQVGETIYVDPNTIEPPKRKRRGRRTRQQIEEDRRKESAKSSACISVNLEKVLISLHTVAAGLLAEPELKIDDDEATMLAEAVKEVAAAYDFTQIFNPKTQALIDLTLVCGTVYGPKVITIYKRSNKRPKVVNMTAAQVRQQPEPTEYQGA